MRKSLFIISLSALALFGCKDNVSTGQAASDGGTQISDYSIAYVNMDSLIVKYDMYTDLRAEYEQEAKKVETELANKGRSFEGSVNDFQDKVQKGLVTRSQAAQMEEDLQRKQQSLMEYRETALSGLAEKEQVMLNRIHYSVVDFLGELNADKRYSMIISNTTTSGPILNADPALDITKEVLDGVNKKYQAEKTKTQK